MSGSSDPGSLADVAIIHIRFYESYKSGNKIRMVKVHEPREARGEGRDDAAIKIF